MYTNELIDYLNEHGVLSTAYIARKYKMSFEYSALILKKIVDDYENVIFKTKSQIYIEGREPEAWKPKNKRTCENPKKKSKYRRIIRPR